MGDERSSRRLTGTMTPSSRVFIYLPNQLHNCHIACAHGDDGTAFARGCDETAPHVANSVAFRVTIWVLPLPPSTEHVLWILMAKPIVAADAKFDA